MKRIQAYKFELMPDGQQQNHMPRFAGSCRFVFNRALALQKERYLAMYLQGVENVYALVWSVGPDGRAVTYGDVYHQNEVEQRAYIFEHANVDVLLRRFDECEAEALTIVAQGLPLPAYEQVCKGSHCFNLLDARRAISVTARQRYILRVRRMLQAVAEAYYAQREKLGFPGLKGTSKTPS